MRLYDQAEKVGYICLINVVSRGRLVVGSEKPPRSPGFALGGPFCFSASRMAIRQGRNLLPISRVRRRILRGREGNASYGDSLSLAHSRNCVRRVNVPKKSATAIRLHEKQERTVLLSTRDTLIISEDRRKNRIAPSIEFVKIDPEIRRSPGVFKCADCIE